MQRRDKRLSLHKRIHGTPPDTGVSPVTELGSWDAVRSKRPVRSAGS
jgi:hypothetical protein